MTDAEKFFLVAIVAVGALFSFAGVRHVRAAILEAVKLPYPRNESFVVVQGYDSPPTHINKDLYAIDFSRDGCDAYAVPALAASSGKVFLAEESGYNGGYGTQVLIDEGGGVFSRYAHLIPGSVAVANGDLVAQGEPIGKIGDSGLVEGAACGAHPGTHLHFAMYEERSDGTFAPHLPEPISRYANITQGSWYLSDNEIETEASAMPAAAVATTTGSSAGVAAINSEPGVAIESTSSVSSSGVSLAPSVGIVLGAATSADASANSTTYVGVSGSVDVANNTPSVTITSENPGAVSFTPTVPVQSSSSVVTSTDASSTLDENSNSSSSATSSAVVATSTSATSTSALVIPSSSAVFDSSTLAIDLSWQAPISVQSTGSSSVTYTVFKTNSSNTTSSAIEIATTTATNFSYELNSADFGSQNYFSVQASNASTVALASVDIPSWFILVQSLDVDESITSWYGDNWYDLGTGFSGLLRSMTLEGDAADGPNTPAYVYLDEYADAGYSRFNQTFTIASGTVFSGTMQKVALGGLDISLQSNSYYRLRTYDSLQNASVMLMGTTASGTAMRNDFIYGAGRVEYIYPFYPYIAMVVDPE